MRVDFRKTYKVTAVYESEKMLSFQIKVKQGDDTYKVWTTARTYDCCWVRGVSGPPGNGDEVPSDDEDILKWSLGFSASNP